MRGHEFAELRAVAMIAEHGSFRVAASRLGMSASALSQTIRTLEERLDIRLLNRTTRSVALTDAGRRLLERVNPALAELDAALADLVDRRETPSGTLRINSPRVALHFLAPLVGPFTAAYPEIIFDIKLDEQLSDIVAGGFDAGIRLGEQLDKDMVAVKLSEDVRLIVVAAPSYIARHGVPETPRDLTRHSCLNYRFPATGSLYRWEFERGSEKFDIAVEGPLITDEPDLAARAALDGAGLAYLFEHQARAHIEDGRFVEILADWTPAFPGFFLYYPSRRQMARTLRAFVDFVSDANMQAIRA